VRVLLVEDEERLASTIARGLRRVGMAVDIALDGKAALMKAAANSYDVIVLDRNLPVIHGDEVCRKLTERHCMARILMLTAAGSVQDRVTGLDLGADDYLPKPFALEELIARIRALGRRAVTPIPPMLVVGDVTLDPARRAAERGGRDLGLTKKEFGLLEVLLAAEGRVVSAEELLEKVWDENTDPFTNVVRVTIMTLRRKLGEPAIIDTVQGVGYRIEGATVVAIAEPAAGEGAEAAADATAGDTLQH
jgi:DNA-binding response OmpR family regulator